MARLTVIVDRPEGVRVCLSSHLLATGETTVVGREAEVGIGIDPVDTKVSRRALIIEYTGGAWHIALTNHNGADLQMWGQPSMPCRRVETPSGPRVAIRLKGSPEFHHWVLLDEVLPARTEEPAGRTPRLTESVKMPAPLTHAQEEALRMVFADLLAWPPRVPAVPRQLKQVARDLGIRREAVQRRLEMAREKAREVGLNRNGSLTDPEYLYVLVRARYLLPRESDLEPPLR